MFIGFAAGRALVSMGVILLICNSFWPAQLKETWRAFKQNTFAKMSVVYFLVYLIGGIYSSNSDYWLETVQIKLPFLLLPFAMLSTPFQLPSFRKAVVCSINISLISIILYSLFTVMGDWEAYRDAYSLSHPLPTNSEDDHIRTSLCLVLAILLNISLLRKDVKSRIWKIFCITCITLFSLYIHILAAKSGLMALYITLLALLMWYFYRKGKLAMALVVAPAIVFLFAFGMYHSVGTFQKKVQYMVTEYDQYKRDGRFDYNYSDNGRLITYDIAWMQIKKHPWIGVGAGDSWDVMRQGYKELYPEVPFENQFIPINQVLYDALAYGLLVAFFVILMIIAPFFAKDLVAKPYLIIATSVLISALMVESMLQVQYGVFIYIFFTMIWYKWQQPYSIE